MTRRLVVRLDLSPGRRLIVGRLAHIDRRIWFEYEPSFLETGLEISPFRLPARPGLIEHRDLAFAPLPGVFDDSLPDGWGLLLMDRAFRQAGIDPATVSALDRLVWLGTRTMGALTYHPPDDPDPGELSLDLPGLARHAEEVIEGETTAVLPELIRAGGSPGGARPKVLVGIRGDRMISGEGDLPDGYEPWIVKFASRTERRDAGPMEFAYSLMARAAGIDMPESMLLVLDRTRRYFAVRRFDRVPGQRRFHMHTLANLLHANFRAPSTDYADFLKVTRALTANHQDVLRAFRLMVFNVAAHNRDDHAKNVAYLMDADGVWTLAPGYDLGFASGPGGEHSMALLGEGRSPDRARCMELARRSGIRPREADAIIQDVDQAIEGWAGYARQADLARVSAERIGRAHRRLGVWVALAITAILGTVAAVAGPPVGEAWNPVPVQAVGAAGGTTSGHRPGTSWDPPLDRPRDLTGRSVKTPRVRAIHTTDPGFAGGTLQLIREDPWLAYQRGRELVQREYTAADGVSGEAGRHAGPTLEDRATRMSSRDRASSCALCHNTPWRDMGAGATIAKHGGRGRNTPHLFGAGLLEMLGWQNRLELLRIADDDRSGWISHAEARGRKAWVDPAPPDRPGGRRILLGRFEDVDGDGLPDLDPVVAVWFVDRRGRRIPWARSLRDEGVAGYSLEYQVFGHGQHLDQLTHGPPVSSTLRGRAAASFDLHLGLQAFDPTLQDDPDGDGLSSMSIAGAVQFVSAAGRDRGAARSVSGVSLDDPDRDGHVEEVSEGDLDLVEWYLLNHPRPARKDHGPVSRRGEEVFSEIGCAGCHVPDWSLHPADPGAADPTSRYPGDRRFFDLSVTGNTTATAVTGRPGAAGLTGQLVTLADRHGAGWIPRRGGFVVEGLYSDLASHDLGEGFTEVQYDGSLVRYHRTTPLWGVGSTAPYGHDGASLDLDAVIRRHGGEAARAAGGYRDLDPADRSALLTFLRSLVLFVTEDLRCDLDGDGRISERFIVAGVDTGPERFNPEWLFRVPGRIEGPVVVSDGRAPGGRILVSEALTNLDEAYGVHLPYLQDLDGNGFPDRRDPVRPSGGPLAPVPDR